VLSSRLILVGGGVRSGKSAFALQLARRLGGRRLFLATAEARDDEMRLRIERHRRERGPDFETVEEPLAVPEAIRKNATHDVILVDCLTLWLTNLLLKHDDPAPALARLDDLDAVLAERRGHTIIVTNEVGMGIVPESALGRAFRDLAGTAHQRLSRTAEEVYMALLGTMLRLKPAPAFIAREDVRP
jgi:adenosylcobinamide kinase/adenosylcobinamide-phosphate guanylyltransferase